ncbi:hypothetical protein NEOLEDRAFT_1129845 [Neolentinus lepideus HHB14362 ss-1]|uniref:DUF7904 domain-containing protein n=1 Tax=Neolentinus lepideus HHB14362 ss-1 TaxID=1314782 RepID=A0A165UCP4_9AGAM|nr:hypothetical protein NEOLEDRAFT_1129845 [Neolentinus lepideus HHB14362 ss-1]
MDASSSVLRPRSFDLPKAGPETDLAEWTSRIKALQRQVDEDEETEQRKLEEEIAASRLARQRRSAMYASPRTAGSATELGRAETLASPLRAGFTSQQNVPEDMKTIADMQKHQDDALLKLMGPSSTSLPSARETSSIASSPPTASRPPISQPKPEPISLAQFMGGRATGPRLNKHTAQQDAHDPTQFEQRTLQSIKAPHPVFGRGGVAMPGLTGKGRIPAPVSPEPVHREEPVPSPASQRERRVSTPSVARRYVEKLEEKASKPQQTAEKDRVHERTINMPTGSAPLKRVSSPSSEPKPELVRRPISHSPIPARRSSTPSDGRITPAPAKSPSSPTHSIASTYATPSRPFTPAQSTTSITSSPPTPSKIPITTPSLARPKQPDPQPSAFRPQIIPSQRSSPAFLRPPPEKQPTPSLSRLKGRGFVQSMVKASSELGQATTGSAPTSPSFAQGKGSGGKRLSNVLDRWPAATSSIASSPPPPISPKPAPMRKSFSVDPTSTSTREPQVIKPMPTGRSLRSAPSMPNISAKAAKDDGPGLGSSNTMISYIKPVKTGDAPPTSRPVSAPPHDIDEKGVRVKSHRTGGSVAVAGTPSSGKPLSHPTKDRVKPRRKGKDGKPSKIEATAAILEEPETKLRDTAVPPIQVTPSLEAAYRLEAPEPDAARARTPPSPKIIPPKEERKEPSAPSEGSAGRVTDRWTNGGVIGVKPIVSAGRVSPQPPKSPQPKGMVGRQALPGLAIVPLPSTPAQQKEERSAVPLPSTPAQQKEERPPVVTRPKHARIPSTGNRATVMDVAQVFNEVRSRESSVSPAPISPSVPEPEPEPEQLPEPEPKPAPIPRLSRPLPAPPLQNRRTSYDKYSALMMPPLEEERTPAPSPAGSLARKAVAPQEDGEPSPTLVAEELKSVEKEEIEVKAIELQQPEKEEAEKKQIELKAYEPPRPDVVESLALEPALQAAPEVVHFDHTDRPLPSVDVQALLKKKRPTSKADPNDITISVDVMTILGNTAAAVQKDSHVFYDTEVLAIIHRHKSKASGLVSNKVWGWCGKKARLEEREERKLQELAKRYGTTLERVQQYSEPTELVRVLGGRIAIRQGTREHWSSENTCMHLVRRNRGYIFIDEHDLNIKNLCSGFSYCLSVLGTFYVWHGCGSLSQERQAAADYARSLAGSPDSIIELVEGESDEDEMFWMILGDRDYAKADYWRWRASSAKIDPRVWRVDVGGGHEPIYLVPSFTAEATVSGFVYVIDCIWEFFVLVGSEARGKRDDIKLALSAATAMSSRTAASRPFTPAVHVVVLPSQLPLDLRLSFRDLDEEYLNQDHVPDHMHLLTVAEAQGQLQKSDWEKAKLQDRNLLPLGVDASMLS